ncbi:MAG: hypothetical protein II336_15225 [Loktanella sp.]|nr:hypothetical protein [Loktanella sp.]
MSETIAVLTYKSVETIIEVGGTQSWVLDRTRAAKCDYVVMYRNAKTRDAEGPELHGSAFMVGKVKDVVPATDYKGRWLILISDYAIVDGLDDVWEGRNPVAYWPTDHFNVDLDSLDYQPIEAKPRGLTIQEAKAGLAVNFNVPESAITISIQS